LDALAHIALVNKELRKAGSALRYTLNFLTDRSFNKFFQSLKAGTISKFRSELDVKLSE
jgi:hypothetical protein